MNRVRTIDLRGDTLTAEAGCILADLQQTALAAGRLFPLSLAAEGSCTIGGNLSTNAGGTAVLRYWPPERIGPIRFAFPGQRPGTLEGGEKG